jgi:hypothetical protein
VTANDPGQAARGAHPDGDKQPQAAPAAEPQDRTGRQPQFVIEIWASPQLRQQNPDRAQSLSEAIKAGRHPAAHRDREPDPQLEIEP